MNTPTTRFGGKFVASFRATWGLAPAIILSTGIAAAMEPPRPGEIEQLRNSQQLEPLLTNALQLKNHEIDSVRLKLAINRGKRTIFESRGMRPTFLNEVAPVFAPPPAWRGLPTTGDVKILALLVEFQDYVHAPANTQAVVHANLFGTGDPGRSPYESLAEYYDRASYGALDLSSGNTLGWYQAGYDRPADPGDATGRDIVKNIIEEAINYFNAQGHDFTQYDNDNDGEIDYFMVFWTGPPGPWASLWWGYKTNFAAYDPDFTVDGKKLGVFSWQWASSPVGSPFSPVVAIHETGHALGLPDLYDYDPTVGPDGGVGGLDMMHANRGDFNCFSKWVLDWLTPTFVASGTHRITTQASGTSADCVVVWPGVTTGDLFSEFFVAQNRHRVANDDDARMPADGMLLWHIDATLDPSGSYFIYNNSFTDRKLVRLMEADGLEEIEQRIAANAGDYWQSGSYFGQHSTPSSRRYDGTDSHVMTYDFSDPGLSTTATYEISAEVGGGWTDDGAVVRLTTDSDRVGVGTRTPVDKLEVQGGQISLDGAGGLGAFRFRQNDTMHWTFLTAPWIGNDDMRLRNEATGRDVITFDRDTDFVGIGSTAPGRRLSVHHQSHQVRLTGQGPNGLEFMDNDGAAGLNLLYRTSPDELRIERGAGDTLFSINRDTRNVNIGNNSLVRLDLANLHNTHPSLSESEFAIAWNQSGGRGETVFYQHGGGGWRSGYDFWTERNGVSKRLQARIEDTGNMRIRGSYKALSDARNKKNVREISNALEKLEGLRGVYFDWVDEDSRDGTRQIGLIAQEVAEHVPEVVSRYVESGDPDSSNPDDIRYDLNYDGLIPILVEGIQEQQAMIDALERRIEALENGTRRK